MHIDVDIDYGAVSIKKENDAPRIYFLFAWEHGSQSLADNAANCFRDFLSRIDEYAMEIHNPEAKVANVLSTDGEVKQWQKEVVDKANDPVNHPSHYTDGKIEVIDFIEDKKLNFHLANAVKYISRAGKKDPGKEIEDLEKARWYLDRYIQKLKEEPVSGKHVKAQEKQAL